MTAQSNFKLDIPGMGETRFVANEVPMNTATQAARQVSAAVNQAGILKVAIPGENSTIRIAHIDCSTIRTASPDQAGERMVERIKNHLQHLAEKTELLGNIIPCQDPREPDSPLPPEWFAIEPTAMPPRNGADVDSVVALIKSNRGLVQDGQSPIFLEGQRFPSACLHAYMEDKITLTQLVSSIMLFSAVREFGINADNASLVKRVELTGAEQEWFPMAPDAQGEERCFYRIQIPDYDKLTWGTKQYFGADDYISSKFVINSVPSGNTLVREIAIPSFSSMQTHLNNRYGKDAVKLTPRWGNSSMHEIFQQSGTRKRVFGLDPEGKSRPDNIEYGPYAVLLHDFYHANLISNIPLSHQLAYKNMALSLLEEAKKNRITNIDVKEAREAAKEEPADWRTNKTPLDPGKKDDTLKQELATALAHVLRETAWGVLDMDIGWYRMSQPKGDLQSGIVAFESAMMSFQQRSGRTVEEYPWYFEAPLQEWAKRAIENRGLDAKLFIMSNNNLDQ